MGARTRGQLIVRALLLGMPESNLHPAKRARGVFASGRCRRARGVTSPHRDSGVLVEVESPPRRGRLLDIGNYAVLRYRARDHAVDAHRRRPWNANV